MVDLFSECVIKVFVNSSSTPSSIFFEGLFCFIATVFGVYCNYTFMKKLRMEKKFKAAGRKGNVIEPIMTGCCWIQMIYWPIRLGIAWIFHNEIIKAEMLPVWMRYTLLTSLMVGRTYLCFCSFFCAFIRYIYIVHYEKVYHWNFEWVAKWVTFASYFIPCHVGILLITVVGGFQFKGNEIFDTCSDSLNHEGNGNIGISVLASILPEYFTISVIRVVYYFTVIVWLIFGVNIVEALMYRSIFATIAR